MSARILAEEAKFLKKYFFLIKIKSIKHILRIKNQI